MKTLLFALLLFVIGCGATSSGGKPKTLNMSNLEKTPAGTYKIIKKPEAKPETKKEAVKSVDKKENPFVKINWFSLITFYLALAWIGYMIWLLWNTYEQRKLNLNPFKEKKDEEEKKDKK